MCTPEQNRLPRPVWNFGGVHPGGVPCPGKSRCHGGPFPLRARRCVDVSRRCAHAAAGELGHAVLGTTGTSWVRSALCVPGRGLLTLSGRVGSVSAGSSQLFPGLAGFTLPPAGGSQSAWPRSRRHSGGGGLCTSACGNGARGSDFPSQFSRSFPGFCEVAAPSPWAISDPLSV